MKKRLEENGGEKFSEVRKAAESDTALCYMVPKYILWFTVLDFCVVPLARRQSSFRLER